MVFKDLKEILRDHTLVTKKLHGIKKEVEQIKEEIEAVRGLQSNKLDGLPHGCEVNDNTQKKAIKIVDIYNQRILTLLSQQEEIINKQHLLTDALRELREDEFAIMEARYIKGIRWDYIPDELHMSRSECFRIHDRAMTRLLQNLKNVVVK